MIGQRYDHKVVENWNRDLQARVCRNTHTCNKQPDFKQQFQGLKAPSIDILYTEMLTAAIMQGTRWGASE